jgi:hypothetical protein
MCDAPFNRHNFDSGDLTDGTLFFGTYRAGKTKSRLVFSVRLVFVVDKLNRLVFGELVREATRKV